MYRVLVFSVLRPSKQNINRITDPYICFRRVTNPPERGERNVERERCAGCAETHFGGAQSHRFLARGFLQLVVDLMAERFGTGFDCFLIKNERNSMMNPKRMTWALACWFSFLLPGMMPVGAQLRPEA